ncbi:Crp/Fnr family transcriptional regulator [Desulfovibrio sp. OttesenSCG-928-C14]|nr:Crp/Fnr family transcriptional regulator [Desulfovibrio sp. OttesenSCG-928-C14]
MACKRTTYFICCDGITLSDKVLKQGITRSFEANTTILDAESGVNNVYYVLEGELAVTAPAKSGEDKNIFFVKKHMIYGELHLFCQELNMCRLTTTRPSVIVIFTFKDAQRLFEENKQFRELFLSSLSRKILTLTAEIASLNSNSTEERIYNCLLELSAHRQDGGEGEIKITQHELSTILGMHRITVNRVLTRLEETGLLKRSRNRITLLNTGTPAA